MSAFIRCLCTSLLLIASGPAAASKSPVGDLSFDWQFLNGKWAESSRHEFACRPDNLHFHFAVSADRKTLTFKLDRKWVIGTGRMVEEYSARIVSAQGRLMVIRYGPELGELSPEMAEWELLFIGPGVYRWRSTAWGPGEYNNVIGVRCA